MKTPDEVGPEDRIVVRHGSSHSKGFRINPWIAFLVVVGSGRLLVGHSTETGRLKWRAPERSEIVKVKLWKEITAVAQGPWEGRSGGKEFYDGRGEFVGNITVHYNDTVLINLQATYEQSGARFQGAPHGGIDSESATIFLDYPLEYHEQVVGTIAQLDQTIIRNEVVTSLIFITNKQAYGPYARPRGQNFQTPASGIVGFYGRSGALLDQLGVLTKQ